MQVRADELTDLNDRLLLEAQRAANRDDWANVLALSDEVVKNDPTRVEAMYLIALCMRQSGNEGSAALVLTMASKLEPNRAPIWIELAKCLHERHPMEAYRAAIKANSIKPDMPDTLSVLCNVASTIGRHAEAVEWAERAESKYGVHPEVCHNKSFALMALGRWAEGWREFKASLGMPNRKKRNYHADRETPRWNPNKHENAVIVIYGEQGIGDEIMYASMIDKAIEAAAAKGSRVVIECYSRNEGLMRRSFPQASVYGTLHEMYSEWPADEAVTHKIEMGGLGEYFATEPFRRGGFLAVDPARVAASGVWLEASGGSLALGDGEGRVRSFAEPRVRRGGERHHRVDGSGRPNPLVGIAWTGGAWESGRGRRSIPFELIMQLMRGQKCTFVNLEYEDRRKDLEFAPDVLNPVTATKKGQDMDELAALVANLDLVISVQTSVVDLCGALGVPCWAITDAVPQWRYTGFFGPDTMGFYESVKVYRQKEWGEWGSVVNQVARDLQAWTLTRQVAADQAAFVAAE